MLRKNALIAYAAEVINLLASFVFVGYFIRTFSTEIYGNFIVLTSFISFSTLYNFGVDSTLKSEYGSTSLSADRVLLLLKCLLVTFLFVIVSVSVVVLLFILQAYSIIDFKFVQLVSAFDVYVIGSIFLVLFSVVQAHILLTSSFFVERVYSISISSASLVATFLTASFHLDFSYFLIFRLILLVLLGGALWNYVSQRLHIGMREAFASNHHIFALKELYYLVRSSIKYISLGASSLVIWSIDPIIIRSALSSHDVGTYSLIFRIITLGLILPTAICTAITPYLSRLYSENNYERLESLYHSTFHTILIIFLPYAFVILLYSDLFVSNWVGREFETSAGIKLFFLAWVALMFINSLNTSIIIITGSANLNLVWVLFAEALIHVAFSIMLVNKFKIEGVAFSAFISFFLTSLPYQFYVIKKRLKFFARSECFRNLLYTVILYASSLMISFVFFLYFKSMEIGIVVFLLFMVFFGVRYFKQGHFTRLIG